MIPGALLDELAVAANLADARCAGRYELFDRTVEADRPGPGGAVALAEARAEALAVCTGCQELTRCGQWLESLPRYRRPLGVIAGKVIAERRPRRRIQQPDRNLTA